MTTDNILSQYIRPAALIFLLLVITALSLIDGNLVIYGAIINIKAAYIQLYQSLLIVVLSFYYGSRGLEKITKIKQDRDNAKPK